MLWLRQSTASQEIPLGYFVDSTDGNTEETGLTIANTDIKIWKTGATTLANKNSGGGTHISNGVYYCVLDATDTDTIGPLVVFIHVSGALAVRVPCVVLDEAVYDSLFGTSALTTGGAITVSGGVVSANAVQLSGDSAAADNAESFFDGTGYAGTNNVIPLVTVTTTATNLTNLPAITTNWLTATGLDTTAVQEIRDAITGYSGSSCPCCRWNRCW